ncbi:Renin r domain containing protein [Trichuris trichiura]|uniref:Renin r domain containing protein n=1 Tax=Trichuris trichiura TaxID=36087 RepID=A0A077YUT0_TRITR|nr:Renin r domain containing protein [Trichuris trichiura]
MYIRCFSSIILSGDSSTGGRLPVNHVQFSGNGIQSIQVVSNDNVVSVFFLGLVLRECAYIVASMFNNSENSPTNYAFYDENYSVIFNICLWLVIAFACSLLYIGVGMWSMDPGRESIVYRMTMTRAKKD